MENKPTPLPIKDIREVKTFSLAVFNINDSIASGETYLVDKKNHKIWMFQMGHQAVDVTNRIKRRYITDINKSLMKRRIGCELFSLMDNQHENLSFVNIIAHSDSAKEITEKIHEVRALQAELMLKICRNHCHWTTEEAAEEHFGTL